MTHAIDQYRYGFAATAACITSDRITRPSSSSTDARLSSPAITEGQLHRAGRRSDGRWWRDEPAAICCSIATTVIERWISQSVAAEASFLSCCQPTSSLRSRETRIMWNCETIPEMWRYGHQIELWIKRLSGVIIKEQGEYLKTTSKNCGQIKSNIKTNSQHSWQVKFVFTVYSQSIFPIFGSF